MNPELEQLIEALDLFRSSPSTNPEESTRLRATYERRLQDVLERHPNLSRQSLESAVEGAYRRWLKAQDKPSAMPPKA